MKLCICTAAVPYLIRGHWAAAAVTLISALPLQLAKRYVNAHALVDLCLSAVFDPPLGSSGPASTKTVQEVCIVISTPTVIEKGAPLPLDSTPGVTHPQSHSVENICAAPQALSSIRM